MSLPTSPNPPQRIILDGYILPAKYILGPSTKALLLFTSAFCPALRIVDQIIYTLPLCDFTTKVSSFVCIHTVIAVINLFLRVLLVLFGFNMDYFRNFISTIELLSIESDDLATRTIKRRRRFNQIILGITFTVFAIICAMYIISSMPNLGTTRATLIIIDEICIAFGFVFLFNMICNICICLRTAFNQINSQIAALNETSHQFSYRSFHDIRNLRRKYSYAVRSTQNAEKLFRYFITIFCIEYFSFNIMHIVRAFEPSTKIDLIWFVPMLNQTVILLLLTYNLVSVNNLSRQGMEDLYEFSFKLNSVHLYHENGIFIARMALSDVGFTFANLFTINNSFITSLFTLSLTIIIALASFIYQ